MKQINETTFTSDNGLITFIHGDCMDVMNRCERWDFACVDPNYGIKASKPSIKPDHVKQKNGKSLYVKSNKYKHSDWDLKPAGKEYFDLLLQKTTNQIIWGVNYYDYKFNSGRLVWDKINGESDQMDCEIAYSSFTKHAELVRFMWSGMIQGVYCGKDINKAAIQQGNKKKNQKRIHVAEKPIQLYRWIFKNYAKPTDHILDTHGGSMSSAIAAHMEGLKMTIIELDKEYFDKAILRFSIYERQQTINFE